MKRKRAFTLVELLVAVAIFAVLSAMGWKVFDYIVTVKERNTQHEQRLSELQHAYQQILKDSLQIAPVTASQSDEVQPALVLNNGRLSFTKTGVTDPLQQGIPPTERIEYYYNTAEQVLYRLKYPNIHQHGGEQPLQSVLLTQVESFELNILNPEAQNIWPHPQTDRQDVQQLKILPKGIQVKLTVHDVAYEWIFSLLNTEFLQESAAAMPVEGDNQ